MGLLKTRPEIRLLAPNEIVAGEPFSLWLELDAKEAVECEGIEVELRGSLVHYTTSQYGRHRHVSPFTRYSAEIEAHGRLSTGLHRHELRFELPPAVPSSYDGKWLEIEYSVHVRVDIPWWADAKAAYLVRVLGRSRAATPENDARRSVFVSRRGGPIKDEPYAELSLASTLLHSDSTLRGAIALSNVRQNRYRAVGLSLVARETLPSVFATSRHDTAVGRWRVELSEPAEGESIDFAVELPDNLSPGFALGEAKLEWFFVAELIVSMARDQSLWVPVQVADLEAGEPNLGDAPLAVGNDRRKLVWREVSRRTAFRLEGDALLARLEGHEPMDLRIQKRHSGRGATQLLLRAEHPDFGLGLGLQGRIGRAKLRPRDPEHARRLERLLDNPPARVREADDRHLEFVDPRSGLSADAMVTLAESFTGWCGRLREAVALLPAPASARGLEARWFATSRRLSVRFEPGPFRLLRRNDARRLGATLRFEDDGTLRHLDAFVLPADGLDARHHLEWHPRAPMPARLGAESFAELSRDALAISFDARGLFVSLPASYDPAQAMARAEALEAWWHRATGRANVYR